MPKSKDEKVFLKRSKWHMSQMNKLLRSVNVYDNRKLIAEYVTMIVDADPDTLRPFLMDLVRAQFIDKRGAIRWKDSDGTEIDDKATKADQEAKDKIEAALADFLKGE